MFLEFTIQLSKALSNSLPGKEAQYKMAPYREAVDAKFKNQKEAKTAGVLILIYPIDNIPHLVLTKRPTYEGHHSAQISFPGGKKEEHDENFMHTALRETEEEIGVPSNSIKIIGELSDLYIPPSNFKVYPFVGVSDVRPQFIKDPKEVAEIIELSISDLLKDDILKAKELKLAAGFNFETPYFDIQNHVVWGATAMMLNELREILLSFGRDEMLSS
jgi:8-oxo-dGTP pyrophosphatase MutT (NUDIX family)